MAQASAPPGLFRHILHLGNAGLIDVGHWGQRIR
jgi:hypothetical protein